MLPLTEKTSSLYRTTLVDETGALVGPSTLSALTLTLYAYDANGVLTYLNSRNAQNVLNQNGVLVYDTLQSGVDENGQPMTYNLAWTMAPADNAIVNDSKSVETHYALFQASWGAGAKGINHPVALPVKNLALVS